MRVRPLWSTSKACARRPWPSSIGTPGVTCITRKSSRGKITRTPCSHSLVQWSGIRPELGERVQAEDVVVVVVREQHLVGHGARGDELGVRVRSGVDQHPPVEQERGAQPAVARVGRRALRAVASESRDRPGSRGAQHGQSHSASHLGWCFRAHSRRTVPSVMPRSEWRVLAFSVAR